MTHHLDPFARVVQSPPPPGKVKFRQVDELILGRIRSAIDWTRLCRRKNDPLELHVRFTVGVDNFPVLDILRQAYEDGEAEIIFITLDEECYELGIEPLPPMDPAGAGIDPRWWARKNAAEVKAGPLAQEKHIKKAGAALKGLATKRRNDDAKGRKTKQQKLNDYKLEEGLRRQERGLPMSGEVADEREGEEGVAMQPPRS